MFKSENVVSLHKNRNITPFISNLLFIQLLKKLQELFTETIYLQTHKNTYINTRNKHKQKAHTKAKQEKNQSACKTKQNNKGPCIKDI